MQAADFLSLKEPASSSTPVLVLTARGAKRLAAVATIAVIALLFVFRTSSRASASQHDVRLKPSSQVKDVETVLQSSAASTFDPLDEDVDPTHTLTISAPSAVTAVDPQTSITSNYTSTIVIGRMVKEAREIEWVHRDLMNVTNSHIYIVDDPTTDLPHLQKNHGREARVYLEYIVANYNALSDITFFWHTKRNVWHNNLLLGWDSVETINRMDRDNIMKQGYVPSRCDAWPGCPSWIKFNPSNSEHRFDQHRLADMFKPSLFKALFPNETEFPPYFAGTCCSQFAVSRDAIQSQPVEAYQLLLDFISDYWNDQHAGMMFELLWPYIFKRKGEHCQTMQACYCETYNVCLKDPKENRLLDDWNSFRARRDDYQWQLQHLDAQWEQKKKLQEKITGKKPESKLTDDDELGPEYEQVLEENHRLQKLVTEKQMDLVRHFKLPKPPTDW